MMTRLTGFITLYGAGLSAVFFGLVVFVLGVGADLTGHILLAHDLPGTRVVLMPPAIAGLASAAVLYPFCRAALRVQAHESELKVMRGQLRDSEARFRDFADAASDWYWEMDENLRFTYLSPRVEEVMGVPVSYHLGKTRAEIAGENASQRRWQEHLDDLRSYRPFKDFRYAYLTPDGRVLQVATSGKPLFSPAGYFKGYRGVARDLTAQLEAETRARGALDLLSSAVEGLTELFVLWDKDDRLVVCNQRYRDINRSVIETTEPGVTFEAHVRAALAQGLYPDAEGREEAWVAERLERHRNPTGAFELCRQDGQWLLINEQKLPGGGGVTVSTDITRLKNAERLLKESEQRLRDFASVAADWFWEQDADLRFTYVSIENEDISGVVATDHYGKTRRETRPMGVTEEELAAHEADLRAHLPFTDFRFSRQRPDGSTVHLSVSGIPLFDDEGAFLGYRGVGRNITAMIEAERDLEEARVRAETLMRAKSDFLARVSHDLSTPLNAILGFAQVMELELLGSLPDSKYVEYARNIRTSGEILSSLISDILHLSQIEAGKLELEDETVDTAALLQDVAMLFTEKAKETQIDFVLSVPGDLPQLRGDRKAILQAVMNLASNAVKFTDAGGSVRISAAADDGLEISVTDTGLGFDMAVLETVLEPFGRADNPSGTRREGVGLGLAITKALIEMHGGMLDIVSAPGKGTTATLRFPPDRTIAAGQAARSN